MESDDSIALKNSKEGDQNARNVIYDAHYERTYRCALSRCHHHATAEDATHLAFIQLLRNTSPIASVGAWLCTVAKRKALNIVRTKKPQELPETVEPPAVFASPLVAVFRGILRSLNAKPEENETANKFQQCLSSLSFLYRFSLWCKYHLQFEQTKIGDLVNRDGHALNREMLNKCRDAFRQLFCDLGLCSDTTDQDELNNFNLNQVLSVFGPAYHIAIKRCEIFTDDDLTLLETGLPGDNLMILAGCRKNIAEHIGG